MRRVYREEMIALIDWRDKRIFLVDWCTGWGGVSEVQMRGFEQGAPSLRLGPFSGLPLPGRLLLKTGPCLCGSALV